LQTGIHSSLIVRRKAAAVRILLIDFTVEAVMLAHERVMPPLQRRRGSS
jgi:hypothetical protein